MSQRDQGDASGDASGDGARRGAGRSHDDVGLSLPEFVGPDDVPVTGSARVREAVTRARLASDQARTRLQESRGERPLIDLALETVERDTDAAGGLLAGALSFRLFLTALPLSLVLISVLGFLFDMDPRSPESLVRSIGTGRMTAASVADSAEVARDGRWVTVLVGFVALVVALRTLIKSFRLVHVLAWRLPLTRQTRMTRAVAVSLVMIVVFLAVSASATWLRERTPGGGVSMAVILAVVWAVAWCVVALLLPRAPDTPWFVVVPGGVLMGIGTQVLHAVTIFYFVRRVASMSDTYGPLGTAVVALLWFYFVSRVFVYAAMLNATIWDRYQRGDPMLPGGWGEWVTERTERLLRIAPSGRGRPGGRRARRPRRSARAGSVDGGSVDGGSVDGGAADGGPADEVPARGQAKRAAFLAMVSVASLMVVVLPGCSGEVEGAGGGGSGSSGDSVVDRPSFLEEPAQVPELLYAEFGEVPRFTRLHLSDTDVSVELRDPQRPENLDRWRYSAGEWTSTPVSVTQSQIDALDETTFGPEAINWSVIPDLIQQAYDGVELEEEQIDSVSFDRLAGEPPRVYIGISGLRGSGRLLAGADGTDVEVQRN